tara:strand:+ start:266 stop:793 length:528 start_codon:yes stop_codon:yes gene_type:complete
MKNKELFFVLGPESSGTRNLTRLLIEAGCVGDFGHEQRFDNPSVFLDLMPQKAVIRRSMPHDNHMINIVSFIEFFNSNGYKVNPIVTSRDWDCMVKSQVAAGHALSIKEAEKRIRLAQGIIYSHLCQIEANFVVVSYESLVQRPNKVLQNLGNRFNISFPKNCMIYDGNEKYFKE